MALLKWLSLFVLVVATLAAQPTAIVRGTLTDSSGAVIPSAPVILTAPDKVQKTATTQADGSYSFLGLGPGQYTVHVEFPGFTNFDRAVTIETGRTIQVPIRMALETAKQEVTVADDNANSTGLSLDPGQNAGGTGIAGTDLDALPDNP